MTPLFMLIWDLLWDDGSAGWWARRAVLVLFLAVSLALWVRFVL